MLLPNAKHPKLKAALSDFRPPVAEHLQLARDIQGMLESETMRANAKSGGV